MSALSDPVFKRRDRATNKLVEQKCSCSGTYTPVGPLMIVKYDDLAKIRFLCKPCNTSFRRVSPARFVCSSCNLPGLVDIESKSVWFHNGNITVWNGAK